MKLLPLLPLLPLLFLLSCQAQTVEPVPDSVVIKVEWYGDITRVYIKNNGIECLVYEGDELIGKERY